jgi:hypothetical protein
MNPLNPSPWAAETKKRVPSLGRLQMNETPPTIEEAMQNNQQTSDKVSALLNQLTANNDGERLSNYEPLSRPEITVTRDKPQPAEKPNVRFQPNDVALANLSNYQQTYSAPQVYQGRHTTVPATNDKLMEKINYMIHLLEEQQMEKTANVTEEFILYILLGVFVIFTVDSFTRAGKYVR